MGGLSWIWKGKRVLAEKGIPIFVKTKQNAGAEETGEVGGGQEWMRKSIKYSEKGIIRWITGAMGERGRIFSKTQFGKAFIHWWSEPEGTLRGKNEHTPSFYRWKKQNKKNQKT